MDPLILTTQEGYDRWAEIYDGEGNPLIGIEEPEMDHLIGGVGGLSVLDVGCGTGRHALRLAQQGARVTAVDFSEGMLARAMAKPGADAVRWIQHDLLQPLPFPDHSFDRVICGLVIDHIAPLKEFFAELGRVRRPTGDILVSVMHPAMMLKGVQARFTDPATGRKVAPASVAHQISDYIMAAVRAGLSLQHVSEHCVTEELAARVPRAGRYLDWPLLFMMQLR